MKKLLLFFIAFYAYSSFSQIIPFTVNLDTSVTKTLDSVLVYVKNPTNKPAFVTQVRNTSPLFFTRVSSFNINPNDSVGIWALFSSIHNLTYRSFVIFETSVPSGGLKYSLVYGLIATAKYPDVMYAFTQGLIDEPLKSALKTWVSSPYTQLGYNTARDRMFETVDDYGGDTIECVYTGRKIKAVTRTEAQNQSFDTEHTWPQSMFGESEPMKSDLHHLFPTYSPANNARSNYPFGYVVSNITWQDGGSKLGRDAGNNIVFEPRDKHKGNVARAMFYFVTRYQNWGSFLTLTQENTLRQFHNADTVDANERLRNDRVKQFQNNRNPFADHPELVSRIRAFYTTSPTPQLPDITASPFTARFDTLNNVNDTVSYFVSVFNFGNANLTISGITSNNSVFTVESFPSTVQPNQYGYARVLFKPNALNQNFSGELTINNNDSTIKVALHGVCGSPIGITQISNEVPNKFGISQNYPNPFNPATNFEFRIAEAGNTKLVVYDMLGRSVETIIESDMQPGTYKINWNASKLSSGVYYYRLISGSFSETRKLILVK